MGGARIAAGEFGAWLAATRAALRSDNGVQVPCGDCRGCCISDYRIPLRPQDRAALEQAPATQLVRAPGRAGGNWLLLPRNDGTCAFFAAGNCSVYAHRPQTCRDYDCRVFAAAGIAPPGRRPVIAERVAAWEFTYADAAARRDHAAVGRAAAFISRHLDLVATGSTPIGPTGIAVLAIKVFELFRAGDRGDPPGELARELRAAAERFDAGSERRPS